MKQQLPEQKGIGSIHFLIHTICEISTAHPHVPYRDLAGVDLEILKMIPVWVSSIHQVYNFVGLLQATKHHVNSLE